jgi:hypothetical protein
MRDLNFELNFKIILIQKSQISIFRKGLNLFEFENVFDFYLNLGFKFTYADKIFEKHLHFLLAAQNSFRPTTPCSPPILFSFSLILFSVGPVSFSAQRTQPTRRLARFRPAPLPSSSFGHLAAAAVPVGTAAPRALGSCLASPVQHPLPSRGKVKHRHHPLHLPDSLFPLPISSQTRNGAINGRQPSSVARPPACLRPYKNDPESNPTLCRHPSRPLLLSSELLRSPQ